MYDGLHTTVSKPSENHLARVAAWLDPRLFKCACRLIQAIAAELPDQDIVALCSLSIFPCTFNLPAAAAVTGFTSNNIKLLLRKLITLGMVHAHADDIRYHLHLEVRMAMQRLCADTCMDFAYARCGTSLPYVTVLTLRSVIPALRITQYA